jgi:hypothetical protein
MALHCAIFSMRPSFFQYFDSCSRTFQTLEYALVRAPVRQVKARVGLLRAFIVCDSYRLEHPGFCQFC